MRGYRTFGSWVAGLTLVASAVAAPAAPRGKDRDMFLELLRSYREYTEFHKLLEKGVATYDDVDPKVVVALPEKVLQARYVRFNREYGEARALEKAIQKQLAEVESRLEATPLSDSTRRADLELKTKAMQDRSRQARRLVFLLSVDANSDILEAFRFLTPEQRLAAKNGTPGTPMAPAALAAATSSEGPLPKMPGVLLGTREQRAKTSEFDKINLTPIDDEFYQTQLGKKLESDLGGRARAWSYDYSRDELYVATGNDVSKVRVKEASPGVRYIQTRVGSRFEEPVGSDTKVDIAAQGRFLTGDKGEETLFGKMPPKGPKLLDLPAGHSENDGHDHHH